MALSDDLAFVHLCEELDVIDHEQTGGGAWTASTPSGASAATLEAGPPSYIDCTGGKARTWTYALSANCTRYGT